MLYLHQESYQTTLYALAAVSVFHSEPAELWNTQEQIQNLSRKITVVIKLAVQNKLMKSERFGLVK